MPIKRAGKRRSTGNSSSSRGGQRRPVDLAHRAGRIDRPILHEDLKRLRYFGRKHPPFLNALQIRFARNAPGGEQSASRFAVATAS